MTDTPTNNTPSLESDNATFSQLGLSSALLKAVEETGYETPSPIQRAAIGPLLAGNDVVGQAQTGTGKTAAFALPALQGLDLKQFSPQILVLTPTRELAIQVAEAMQTYARYLQGFRILPVYGGQGMDTQLRQLKRGVHAVVGTPGRIQDHIRRGTLKLGAIKTVVLDEADEMLRMGFVDDVDEILSHTPEHKQVALFSATMPGPIRKIAQRHLNTPVEVNIKAKVATVATVRQRCCQVSPRYKLDALTRILEVEDFDAMVIFVRTKTLTVELAEKLEARGFSSAALNGDMNQALRERTVNRLKKGGLDILVATDVAARGLDVNRISHVVNYDIPYDTEAYIHRIGRTARAGRSGEAIIFIAPRETRMLRSIEKATGKSIETMPLPSAEDIADRRIDEFTQLITDTLTRPDLAEFEALITEYQQSHGAEPASVAAALAFLVQRDRPLRPDLERIPSAKEARSSKDHRDARGSAGERAKSRGTRRTKPDPQRPVEKGMARYRLAVGREHDVMPKHIVGAIANEAGLDSENIGRIELYDRYSTVELPEGMPSEVFQHLHNVRVCGERMRLKLDDDSSREAGTAKAPRAKNADNAKAKVKAKRSKPKTKDKKRADKGKRKKDKKNKTPSND